MTAAQRAGTYLYSFGDEGHFYGHYRTRAEAAEAGLSRAAENCEGYGLEEVWVGKADDSPKLSSFFEVGLALDNAHDRASEEYGDEVTESWDLECGPEALKELDLAVAVVVDLWAEKHGLQPQFAHVIEVERAPHDQPSPRE